MSLSSVVVKLFAWTLIPYFSFFFVYKIAVLYVFTLLLFELGNICKQKLESNGALSSGSPKKEQIILKNNLCQVDVFE
jgi:hypothetical protein